MSLMFDSTDPVEHPSQVMIPGQRLTALALCVALLAGNATLCAGWASTPEARMACCTDGGHCPMHDGESHESQGPVTQAQADSCCAASQPQNSQQQTPLVTTVSAAVLGTPSILPLPAPALVLSGRWRTLVPLPTGPVPRHVLLSVFLV